MSLSDAFRSQAEACTGLGSPFMGQLLTMLADHWPEDSALGKKFARFEGDIGPAGHSLPLRIAGGLHALVLSNEDADLASVYPPNTANDADLKDAVLAALERHEAFLLDWTDNAPQTNEVRRSAALIAGAHVAASHFDLPIVLSELGASGGLNLMWDHFGLDLGTARFGPSVPALTLTPDWDGPLPPDALPQVAERAGVGPQSTESRARCRSVAPDRLPLARSA